MCEEINRADNMDTILYVGGFELPDKNAAAHRVLSNAKLFGLLGYNTVFIGINKEEEENLNIFNSKKTINGFISYSVPYPKSIEQWIKYISQIDNYIEVASSILRLKAIVCYNFPAIALEKIRRYCRKKSIKCIADVTEWYTGLGRSIPVKIIKGIDTSLRMRIIQKKVDGLIVISKFLQKYYRRCKNVVYIPPLTDLSDEKWINTQEKSQDVLFLTYAGNPGRKDRIDLLIKALGKVNRPYQLDIVGIEKEEYISMYSDEIFELDKNKNHTVIFHGRLPHLEALEIIKRANYSCFFRVPDRVTMAGFPTKFAEAITCGTPVITNRSSNVADYLKGKNGYLVEDLSCEAISRIINAADFTVKTNNRLFDYKEYEADMKIFFSKIWGC